MDKICPELVAEFRKQNGFDVDEERSAIWLAKLGPLELPLPNFRWRRQIIAQHDINHLLSGFDTSAKGELLVTSWETGAKCYTDWRARLLCLILMLMGLIRFPKPTFDAFDQGRLHLQSKDE